MRRTTATRTDDVSPRPIGQSFWLFATMALALVVVMVMGDALAEAQGAGQTADYTGSELLELAESVTSETGNAGDVNSSPVSGAVAANPAAPSIGSADPLRDDSTGDESRSEANAASTNADGGRTDGDPVDNNPTDGNTNGGDPAEGEPPAGDSAVGDASDGTASDREPAESADGAGPDGSDPADESNATPATPTVEHAGQAALATISYPWRELLPGWTITFLPEKSGLYGLTMVPEKQIEIYVRENQSRELLAHVIAHELGHAVDVTLNDGPDRRRWGSARGLDSEPWWPGNGATDFSTGAGDFAESFAAWQVGDQSFRSKLAGAPTDAQIALLAELSAG